MAITFNFNEKCGEAIFSNSEGKEYSINLYVGNCFLIMVNEYQENGKDKYSLYSFFVDEDHMERCLKNDIFSSTERLVKIRINKAKCSNYKKIAALLVEYMENITIEIYKEGEQIWKEYKEPEPIIPDVRMRELAESAISYLNDEDMLRDFLDDRDMELSDEEADYFGIYDEED